MFRFKSAFIRNLFVTIGVLGLLSGCASIRYSDDFKSGTDFSELKTYNWRAVTSNVGGLDSNRLRQVADQQLQAAGFAFRKDAPDLLIDLQAFTRASTGGGTSIGIGLGLPIGNSGSFGLGTNKALGNKKQEGVIVMDVTKATTNTLIWRGNAEKIPLSHFTLKAESQLSTAIAGLITQFPPKKR